MAVEPLNLIAEGGIGAAASGLDGPTVTAFIGRTERGPMDRAVEVTSIDEYRRHFGGHSPCGYVSHAVHHYFMHGGARAVVVRVANGARRAKLEAPGPGGALRLVARCPGAR